MHDRKPLYGHTSYAVPASGLISPVCIAIVVSLEMFHLAEKLRLGMTSRSDLHSVTTKVAAAAGIDRKLQSGVELVDKE